MHFLVCLARAVVRNGFRILADALPMGNALYEVAADAWRQYHGRPPDPATPPPEAALAADVEALARAPAEQVRQEAADAVREAAADQPPELQLALTTYLTQVPAMIRRSLRGPSDPTGTTSAVSLSLQRPDDLLALLPPRLPRFKSGDRPLPGVSWELEELLGVGGFGEVWKARHPEFKGIVAALKFCLDERAAKTLRHEAANLDRVLRHGRHPGIVPLRQVYLDADPVCLEYEYVEGGDLTGLIHELHRGGPPDPAEVVRLVLSLAATMKFAHGLTPPLVHRDLKPANILVSGEWRVASGEKEENSSALATLRIADFGISEVAASQALGEATRAGSTPPVTAVRGAYTPLYASPQQVRGEPADPRDDVHALGVIWHQMLTGDLGRGRPSGRGWRKQLAERGVSGDMLDLLEASMDDDPAERPADAGELARRLEALLRPGTRSEQAPTRPVLDPVSPTSEAGVRIRSPKRQYVLVKRVGIGDVSDVYRATADGGEFLLKISRIPEGAALLDAEARTLAELDAAAGETHYRKYFPTLDESFPVRDGFAKRVNVFAHRPGYFTLEQVRAQHPAGLDGRHLAWIFKRMLTALGFVHRCRLVHGAVLPSHVLLHAADHGLQLVGWPHAVADGQRIRTISTRYRDWYPPEVPQKKPATATTDIYLAAKCIVYLAGGDPATNRLPEFVPGEMQRFARACLLEGQSMRPGDAWKLLEEFDEILRGLYGPPKFHPFTMTQED